MMKTIIDKLRLSPDRLMSTKKISHVTAYLILGYIAALIVISKGFGYHFDENEWIDIAFLASWVSMLSICMYSIAISQKHRVVCKALAGLELHQYHCAEDLVFGLGIEYDLAESIVQGEYDCLLMDPLTCYYIH